MRKKIRTLAELSGRGWRVKAPHGALKHAPLGVLFFRAGQGLHIKNKFSGVRRVTFSKVTLRCLERVTNKSLSHFFWHP